VKKVSGEYFAMDVYGGGNDQEAIKRAFFGRKNHAKSTRNTEDISSDRKRDATTVIDEEESEGDTTEAEDTERDEKDESAAAIFGKRLSLRRQLPEEEPEAHISVVSTEKQRDGEQGMGTENASGEAEGQRNAPEGEEPGTCTDAVNAPLDIIGDLSGRALTTGAETADAAYQLLETSLRAVFGQSDKNEEGEAEEAQGEEAAAPYKNSPFSLRKLVPRRARYKWRRVPIPARFLGSQDHIVLRDLPEQYVFLNMSTSEVLCTTTAEALAMGKFVILPKHRECCLSIYPSTLCLSHPAYVCAFIFASFAQHPTSSFISSRIASRIPLWTTAWGSSCTPSRAIRNPSRTTTLTSSRGTVRRSVCTARRVSPRTNGTSGRNRAS